MSIKTIVEDVQAKITEMGGGEQFIGKLAEMATICGYSKEGAFELLADLGDALDREGLQLVSGAGRPQDLYARPKEAKT